MRVKLVKDRASGAQTLTAGTSRGETLDMRAARWLAQGHWYMLPFRYEDDGRGGGLLYYDVTGCPTLHDMLHRPIGGVQYAYLLMGILSVMEQCEAQGIPVTCVQWDPRRIHMAPQGYPLFMVVPTLGGEVSRDDVVTLLTLLANDRKVRFPSEQEQGYQAQLARFLTQVGQAGAVGFSSASFHDFLAWMMPGSVQPRATQAQAVPQARSSGSPDAGNAVDPDGATQFGATATVRVSAGDVGGVTIAEPPRAGQEPTAGSSAAEPPSAGQPGGNDDIDGTVLSRMNTRRDEYRYGVDGAALRGRTDTASAVPHEDARDSGAQATSAPPMPVNATSTPKVTPASTVPASSSGAQGGPAPAPDAGGAVPKAAPVPVRAEVTRTAEGDDEDSEDATMLRPSRRRPGGFVVRRLRDGREIVSHAREATIGRSKTADIHMGGNTNVSRIHATITMLDDGRFSITDHDSANGTSVGGRALASGGTEYMRSGGDFALADDTFVVRRL